MLCVAALRSHPYKLKIPQSTGKTCRTWFEIFLLECNWKKFSICQLSLLKTKALVVFLKS